MQETTRQGRTRQMICGNRRKQTHHVSSFGVRLLISILLFLTYLFFDLNKIKVAEITSDKIVSMISADYELHMEEWFQSIIDWQAQ